MIVGVDGEKFVVFMCVIMVRVFGIFVVLLFFVLFFIVVNLLIELLFLFLGM